MRKYTDKYFRIIIVRLKFYIVPKELLGIFILLSTHANAESLTGQSHWDEILVEHKTTPI